MIRVLEVPDITMPGWSRAVRQVEWRPRMRVRDLVPADWPVERVRAFVDGKRAELDSFVADLQNVALARIPEGVEEILLQLAIAAAASFISAKVAPKPKPQAADSEPTTLYSFKDLQNRYANGSPVPVVYGKHLVAGPVLSLFSRQETPNGDALYMLTAVSEGEIEAFTGTPEVTADADDLTGSSVPDTVKINDAALTELRGAKVSLRMGSNSQAHIPSFSDVRTTNTYDTTLTIAKSYGFIDQGTTTLRLALPGTGKLFGVGDTIRVGPQENGNGFEEDFTVVAISGDFITVDHPAANNFSTINVVRRLDTVTVSPSGQMEAADLNFILPDGLYLNHPSGAISDGWVSIEYSYKPSGGSWSSWQVYFFQGTYYGEVRLTHRVNLPSKDVYQWRFRRVSVPWDAQQTMTGKAKIWTVDGIIHDGLTYPNTALLAVKALGSRRINTSSPTVTALVKGRKVRVYTGANPTTYVDQWSQNPAWTALDLLMSTRYGGGARTTFSTHIEPYLQRWIDWAAYCDEWVRDGSLADTTVAVAASSGATRIYVDDNSGFVAGETVAFNLDTSSEEVGTIAAVGTDATGDYVDVTAGISAALNVGDTVIQVERRHQCDIVLEKQGSLWEALQQIAACGRAAIATDGRRVYPVWDRPQDPVMVFSSANIVAGSFAVSHDSKTERPNTIEVAFLNAERNYEQDLARVRDAVADANGDAEVVETVQLYGVTRPSHAYREGRYHLLRRRMVLDTYQWEAGVDAVLCEPGDVVVLQHPTIVDGKGCRVTAATSSSITLDQDVTIPAGETYLVRVQHKTSDTYESQTLAEPPGTYQAGTALTIAGTWATTPEAGAVVAHGPATKEAVEVVVDSVMTTADLQRRIVGHRYVPDIYSDVGDETVTEQATYGGSGSVANVPPRDHVLPSAPQDLSVVETIETDAGGNPVVKLGLGWRPPAAGLVARYQLWWRKEGVPGAATGHWTPLGETIGTSFEVRGSKLEPGATYSISIVAIGLRGASLDPEDGLQGTYTLQGPGLGGGPFPGEVGAKVKDFAMGGAQLELDWPVSSNDVRNQPDFVEVRLGGWLCGRTLTRTVGTYAFLPTVTPSGGAPVYCRARSKAGQWQPSATVVTPSVSEYAGTSKVLDTADAPTFGGTKTSMVVASPVGEAAYVTLSSGATSGSYETTTKDAGSAASGRRMVWVEWEALQFDGDATLDGATYSFDSDQAKRRSFEGDLLEEHVTITAYIRSSADGVTWGSWQQVDAPIEDGNRYFQAKLAVATDDADIVPHIYDLRIVALDA